MHLRDTTRAVFSSTAAILIAAKVHSNSEMNFAAVK
jgi:hypothetical protein